MPFNDIPVAQRPRERLMALGAGALLDAELLALLLNTGMPGKNVLQFAHELLDHFGGLDGLFNAEPDDLRKFKGLGGTAKRAKLIAVLELARRSLGQRLKERESFDSPMTAKNYVQLLLAARPYEVFAAAFLDAQHRLIAMEELFRGTLTHTAVYPREVVTRALHHNAAAVVLAHNHPSGCMEPSRADETLTRTLKAALALIDVRVLDHMIVGKGEALSMAEHALI